MLAIMESAPVSRVVDGAARYVRNIGAAIAS